MIPAQGQKACSARDPARCPWGRAGGRVCVRVHALRPPGPFPTPPPPAVQGPVPRGGCYGADPAQPGSPDTGAGRLWGGLREHGQRNNLTGGLGTSSSAATPCPWAAGREGGRALGGPPGALRRSPEGTPPPPPGLRTFGLVTQRLEKLTPNCQEVETRREASWVLRRQRRVSDHAEMWRPSRVASGG